MMMTDEQVRRWSLDADIFGIEKERAAFLKDYNVRDDEIAMWDNDEFVKGVNVGVQLAIAHILGDLLLQE